MMQTIRMQLWRSFVTTTTSTITQGGQGKVVWAKGVTGATFPRTRMTRWFAIAKTVTARTRSTTSRPIHRRQAISAPLSWVARTQDTATWDKDAGPGDSDCWGCHGFAMALAPGSGPLIPTVYSSDLAVITAGTDTTVFVAGAAFTNSAGKNLYESDVALTGANGSTVVLTPDIILDEGMLAVTIPGKTPAGNYNLQAVKDEFASNPTVITIVPTVRITRAAGSGTITISGSGFGGYAKGSGTVVTGKITSGKGKKATTKVLNGKIVSWVDGKIVARFDSTPNQVTVNSVFGSATSTLSAAKKPSAVQNRTNILRTLRSRRR